MGCSGQKTLATHGFVDVCNGFVVGSAHGPPTRGQPFAFHLDASPLLDCTETLQNTYILPTVSSPFGGHSSYQKRPPLEGSLVSKVTPFGGVTFRGSLGGRIGGHLSGVTWGSLSQPVGLGSWLFMPVKPWKTKGLGTFVWCACC